MRRPQDITVATDGKTAEEICEEILVSAENKEGRISHGKLPESGKQGFQESLNSEIYVDKTGLIRKNECSFGYKTKVPVCKPTKTFWKINGSRYACCLL